MDDAEQQLDLTNAHRHTLDGLTLSPDLTSVDLTANRLTTIEPCILALTGLRSLSLRQNLLHDAQVADQLASKAVLQNLELRDNTLQQVPELRGFSQLTRLELSYNQISSISPLSTLGSAPLVELYLACNKIKTLESLQQFTRLRVLELGSNRMSTLEGLESLTNLEELWLGHNRVSQLSALSHLRQLKKLSVQSNRLTSMAGVGELTQLRELYLSHNAIERIESLEPLVHLQILDISNNGISRLDGLATLTQLQDLWLNHNRLTDMAAVREALQPLRDNITTIYLEGNKLADHPDYKSQILAAFPHLKQLDADDV